jgi:DNA repair exonuclease SbcCD ATPase subunit
MKMKSWIVWLLLVIFLVSEVLLFSTTCQKNALLDSLGKSQQLVSELQTQLDQLKNSMATAQNAEISKLRADNQDLPRLRNQVTQLQSASQKLQATNQKLTQQLNATLTAAQQQQSQLQQLAVENQQARAVAQQTVTQAEESLAERNTCINHLRQIDAAKNQWALENNKTTDAIPTAQDIAPYIKLDANGNIPGCPSGGIYAIGAVGVSPTCSIPGHVLP